MSLEKLTSKYIDSATYVLYTLEMVEEQTKEQRASIEKVIESAKAYLEDARHFRNEGRLELSLTSVAYCEGLLDALRMLGAVTFEWPSRTEFKREK
jgi:FAD synthetase